MEYIPKNIEIINIKELSMQDLESFFYHFSLNNYLQSYDIGGMKACVGENSNGIDKEISIFFSKGLEGVLELWDVWLKWRLNRQNNPIYHNKSEEEISMWIRSYINMDFLNMQDLLEKLFEYQLDEMKRSYYFIIDLIEKEDYIEDQIDYKKYNAIKNSNSIYMQKIMYGKYSDFNTLIVDKWNMQTIPGKNIIIPPNRLKMMSVDDKYDVCSIVEFMYDKYKQEIPIHKQVKFDLLDKYIEYCKKMKLLSDNISIKK